MAEPGRQRLAAHGGDVRRPDERPRTCRPLRRRDAEALVGEQHDADVRRVRARVDRLGAVGLRHVLRPSLARVLRHGLLRQLHRPAGSRPRPRRPPGAGVHPARDQRPAVPLPDVDARLLPVRLRRDHADPDARRGARPDQLQGMAAVRAALDDVHLHRQRLPDLGRRLLGPEGRGRLQRRLRHPSRRGRLGLRRRGGDRPAPGARPRDRRAEQPADGRVRRRSALARLERLQRRRPVLRGRGRRGCRPQHEPRHGCRLPRLGRLGLRHRPEAVADRQRQRHDRRPRRDHARRPASSTATARWRSARSAPASSTSPTTT